MFLQRNLLKRWGVGWVAEVCGRQRWCHSGRIQAQWGQVGEEQTPKHPCQCQPAASSATLLPSPAFPAASVHPSAAPVPRVAPTTRPPSTSSARRRSSGPVAAIPLLVPLTVPISVSAPLSVSVSASPGCSAARRHAAILLPALQPFLLLLAFLLLLLQFLMPSLALLLSLCAIQKPLRHLRGGTNTAHCSGASTTTPVTRH